MATENPQEPDASARVSLINRVVGGRYEVLESVGEGPILTAFRARDRQQNRIVALKTLRPIYAARPDVVEKLKGGFSETLPLQHASIARGFDVGDDPEQCGLFYIEEYIRGIDLKERIRRAAPFQLTAAVDIAIALGEALEYAHGRGLAHGDVRPHNVLIGPESQVKLTGFGVGPAQSSLSAENPQLLMKIAPYLAPDLAASGIASASADIYALCVVLFEMLTGETPFRGDNPIQIAIRHAQDPAPSPRTINQGVPRALEGIVLKGLAKRPVDRYRLVSQMLQDLRAVRDALRFGKSLSWSPMDPSPESEATIPTRPTSPPQTPAPAVTLREGANPIVPTPPAGARVSAPVSVDAAPVVQAMPVPASAAKTKPAPAPEFDDDTRERRARPRGVNWLLTVNLLLLLLLVGAVGVVATWVRPLLYQSNEVVVPNLVGKTETEAKALSAERHFQLVVVDRQYRDTPAAGVVYAMKEVVGSRVREGKPISVWISRGPEMVEVPEVRDMSLDKARKQLERTGLKVGAITYEFHPITPKGNVLSQAPDTIDRKPRGTPIDLVISKGEEPLPTPEPYATPEPLPAEPSGGTDTQRERSFRIPSKPYVVPAGNQSHRIRIDVDDSRGITTVYDEVKEPGDEIQEEITVYGSKITIRLYDNDVLTKTAAIP